MTRGGWAWRFASWAVVGAFAGMICLVGGPKVVGMTSLTVLSGSMRPAFEAGDVVIGQRIAPADARTGDVITFADPQREGRLVTHRVRGVQRAGGRVSFVTQGDANTGRERFTTPADGTIGRAVLRVPNVGHVTHWAGGRAGKLALVAVPAALLVLLELGSLAGLVRRRGEGSSGLPELGRDGAPETAR